MLPDSPWAFRRSDFLRTGQLRLHVSAIVFAISLSTAKMSVSFGRRFPPKDAHRSRVDELDIHPHLVIRLLHATLQDVRHAKLLGDLREIVRRAFEMLRRRAGDHFQVGDLCQPRQNFVLDALGEVGVRLVLAQVLEGQDGDRLGAGAG